MNENENKSEEAKEAKMDELKKEAHFRDLAEQFEAHKAKGGTVFDFFPEPEPTPTPTP